MKLNAFFPKPENGEDFGSILAKNITDKHPEKLFLVCAEYRGVDNSKKLVDCFGLDFALNLDRGNSPMIICSFMKADYFLKKDKFAKKFSALMGQPRVCFMQIPFKPSDVEDKFRELLSDQKEEDVLATELNKAASYNDIMGTIQHRVSAHFQKKVEGSSEAIASAVAEAREKLNLSGTDEEIARKIKNFRRENEQSAFAGKFFPGVFCDIENTLLVDGEVNNEILKKLQDLSKTKPITLWTGAVADMKKIQEKLLRYGITWKLISKVSLNGAEVEMAYDDEEFDVFFDKYNVKVRKFIQV
ncbi:MAG: hypothetical protein ACLFNO_03175 [Parcubacteria group bacterium]